MNSRRSNLLFAQYLGLLLLLSACAGAPYKPAQLSSVPFQERAETQVSGLIEVALDMLNELDVDKTFAEELRRSLF